MIRLALLAAFAASPAMAEDWTGLWADPPGQCANTDRIGKSITADQDPAPADLPPAQFTARRILWPHTACDVLSVTPLGMGQSWRVEQYCYFESQEFERSELFLLDRDGLLTLYDGDGYRVTLSRCE